MPLSFRHIICLLLFLATIEVSGQITISSQIAIGADDAEENLANGSVSLGSSDLEITSDGSSNQLVGLRFQNITLPQGSTILSASIQFTTDEIDSSNTSILIHGEDVDNASAFLAIGNNISNRTSTAASVEWNDIPPWNIVGEAGLNQQTPDLTIIVQEIVNRAGWSNGNSMAFLISGFGERTAESYNGSAARAAVLSITATVNNDPLPSIVPNPFKGLPFIYFITDSQSELYSVAPDPTASPLPVPNIINITNGGAPISFDGEGGGFRSTDQKVYVFDGGGPGTLSSDMYSIDPSTGIANVVKPNVVGGHVEGAEFYINNSTGEEVMLILYQNGNDGGPDRIMALNPNPSATNPAWFPYLGYPKILSGDITRADGISWNPDTTEFYLQNDDNVDYFTLDITTGNTTAAFSTSFAIDGEGITYASDGTNYIEDENDAGLGRTIFIVDTETGDLIPAAQLNAVGDVESIMGNLGTRNDAGDAPSSYGYAAHLLPVLNSTPISIYLGANPPDSENPFVNFSNGFSDDNTGDDEDGVFSEGQDFSGQFLTVGQTKTIEINTNGAGVLNAWIDFNIDGDFNDSGEQIATDVAPTAGSIKLNVPISLTATPGLSYARFRFSSETGLASGNTEALNGEVEDYQVVIYDPSVCPSGTTLVETPNNVQVYATAVIVDISVNNQNNALGNNNSTSARFNNNNDELVLEMGQLLTAGHETTVNGTDGNVFDVWISDSATGPFTQVGDNIQLDFTFTSTIDWQYIRLKRAAGGNSFISFIDANATVISSSCEADHDGDAVADQSDLDNDNDGIPDLDETAGNMPYGDEDGDGILNALDTIDNGNGGDGSITAYSDLNSDGIPDIYDIDLDGIPNHLDLDSDNDGIYDAVEAGHDQLHTNGIINSVFGANGLGNLVETSAESGAINYILSDSDTDTNYDFLSLDADADGCSDVIEAGFTDPNNDDFLGPNPITVDSNGVVTSGAGGYTVPEDADTNGTFDFQELVVNPSITSQPINQNTSPGCDTTFTIGTLEADTYQWQLFNGISWVNLTNSGIHSGTQTNTLTITNAAPSDNGNQYRVRVSKSTFKCITLTSNSVFLTVNVGSVITNRRITYRVKKN